MNRLRKHSPYLLLLAVVACSGGHGAGGSAVAHDAEAPGTQDAGASGVDTTCNAACASPCVAGHCPKAVAISAGQSHTCALLSNGTVKCWGDLVDLGDGTNNASPTPVAVLNVNTARAVAAGFDQTCVLLSDGTVSCWGTLTSTSGGGTDVLTPTLVPNLDHVTALTAGARFTCALVVDGSVSCWGYNVDGELGNGTTTPNNPTTSTTMLGPVLNVSKATAIMASGDHACALLSTGTLVCWGSTVSGGVTNDAGPAPTPDAVPNLSKVASLGAGTGAAHICVVLSNGSVECWGDDEWGQLGDGATTATQGPTAPVPGVSGVTQVVTGLQHTCVLVASGSVRCWGASQHGQLGTLASFPTGSSTPVDVALPAKVASIAAGVSHTCALLVDGTVECWGDNVYGQLGNGMTTTFGSPTPTAVTW